MDQELIVILVLWHLHFCLRIEWFGLKSIKVLPHPQPLLWAQTLKYIQCWPTFWHPFPLHVISKSWLLYALLLTHFIFPKKSWPTFWHQFSLHGISQSCLFMHYYPYFILSIDAFLFPEKKLTHFLTPILITCFYSKID